MLDLGKRGVRSILRESNDKSVGDLQGYATSPDRRCSIGNVPSEINSAASSTFPLVSANTPASAWLSQSGNRGDKSCSSFVYLDVGSEDIVDER